MASAKIQNPEFNGPYWFNGKEFKSFKETELASGTIQKYTNDAEFCYSYFLHPASWLINDVYVFVISVLIIIYLCFGVAVAVNYMVQGVEQIVSCSIIKVV